MKNLTTLSITMLSVGAALYLSVGAQAAPVTYNGTATILPGVDDVDGKLTDFLAAVPAAGDSISFSAVFDADTIGPGAQSGTDDTFFYQGGLTSIEFTIGATTLSATVGAPNEAGIIATTETTDQLGIPFFTDGYSITIGSPFNDGNRWAANLFFFDANSDLLNADAPTELPGISDFQFVGFGFRSFRDAPGVSDFLPAGFGSLLDTLAVETPTGGGGTGGGGTGGGGSTPPNTVSEPGSVALLLGGLAGIAAIRRRRT